MVSSHLLRKIKKVSGTIFKVFFGCFTSPSRWHLAIFSQQKTGPGVMPVPSGEIERVAWGGGGGGLPNTAKFTL